MLPSLLAKDIQTSLKQFLVAAYEPADPFMHGLMSRFVADPSGWLKGPYLQVGLPFTPGTSGRNFFSNFETEFPGHNHQEASWKRLSSQHLADHTLVATGTGSGKTECFAYPVLDLCARARKAGEGGIKALVIYPMNALATDQARRFAELVAGTPAFAGLRVGMYVGGSVGDPGQGMVMTAKAVITDNPSLKITEANVKISDLSKTVVQVKAQATGPLAAMLSFTNNSPLRDITEKALINAKASGNSDYIFNMNLPIAQMDKASVDGQVKLIGNEIQITPDTPVLKKVTGQVIFNE